MARRMFDVLINAYPGGYTKEDLGELSDIQHTGGSFGTYLSILRSNSLVEVRDGMIKAARHLFEVDFTEQ